jgi:hypothetical protein
VLGHSPGGARDGGCHARMACGTAISLTLLIAPVSA